MSIRVLIVDDEPLARETIRVLLNDREDVDVVGECRDGDEAISAIRAYDPDLVFLDIQMPGKTGFEVVEAIGPAQMPVVIFATAFDEYALQAFEAHALDYLLKPYDDDRFEQALNRALEQIKQKQFDRIRSQLVGLLGQQNTTGNAAPERIMIKERDTIFFVKVPEIDWVEAAGDYVNLHVGKKSHLLRETMSGMERRLGEGFVRVHRSTIINIERVRELSPTSTGITWYI